MSQRPELLALAERLERDDYEHSDQADADRTDAAAFLRACAEAPTKGRACVKHGDLCLSLAEEGREFVDLIALPSLPDPKREED